jgi:hypothetical protein
MADEVAKLTVLVDAASFKQEMQKLTSQGLQVSGKYGGKIGGKEAAIVQASGTAAQIEGIYKALPQGTRAMYTVPTGTAQVANQTWRQKLTGAFTQQNMYRLNKSLFMMQMASLGVAFSFQSIMNSALGLFSGLSDLGAMIAGGAIGTAFAGIATGGANTTDIAGVMGVTTEMSTAAWAGFTAIVNQFKAVFDALAVKVLSPDMVAAILSVIDAIASQLANPEVSKAIQEIIIAILNLALAVLPLIPLIAEVINWLGDTGLLGLFIGIIFAAQILLPTLAYLQFIFQGLLIVGEAVALVMAMFSIPLWAVVAAVAAVIIIIDFLIHVFENLAAGMNPLDAVLTAVGQTIKDVINIIIGALNPILGFLGMSKIATMDTSNGRETAQQTTARTTVNNFNFNKSVNTADKRVATQMASQVGQASMG